MPPSSATTAARPTPPAGAPATGPPPTRPEAPSNPAVGNAGVLSIDGEAAPALVDGGSGDVNIIDEGVGVDAAVVVEGGVSSNEAVEEETPVDDLAVQEYSHAASE